MLHPSVNTILDQKRSWQELSLLTNRDPLRHCLSLLDTLHWQGREAQLTTRGEVWTLSSNCFKPEAGISITVAPWHLNFISFVQQSCLKVGFRERPPSIACSLTSCPGPQQSFAEFEPLPVT